MNKELLKKIILSMVENNALPPFNFKQGTPIADMVAAVSGSSSRKPDESDVDMVGRWMDNLMSQDNHMLDVQINEISKNLTDGILGISRVLRSLHGEVSDITQKIEKIVDLGISINPALAASLNGKEIEHDYMPVDFSILECMGTKDTVMEAMSAVVGINDAVSRMAYLAVGERYIQMQAPGEPVDIDVSSDDKKDVLAAVNAAGTSWDKDSVASAFTLLTSATRSKSFVSTVTRLVAPSVDKTVSMMSALQLLQTYGKTIVKVQDALIAKGYDVAATAPNLKRAYAALEVLFFYVQYQRTTAFADTLVFNNLMRNPDLVEAGRGANISDLEIARYIAVKHHGKLLVATGATLSSITTTRKEVAELFEKEKAADEVFTTLEVAKIRRRAFNTVVSEYLESIGQADGVFVEGSSDNLLRTKATVDETVYAVLIAKLYANTMVGAVHARLGLAYSEAVKDNPSIDMIQLNEKTLEAYLSIVVELMAKNLVC